MYIDGGIRGNYPLKYCIDSGKCADEILGFKNRYNTEIDKKRLGVESSLLDFVLFLLFKIIFSLNTDKAQPMIKYECICNTDTMNVEGMKMALSRVETRKQIFANGVDDAKSFCVKMGL